jgi:choline-sulfatase
MSPQKAAVSKGKPVAVFELYLRRFLAFGAMVILGFPHSVIGAQPTINPQPISNGQDLPNILFISTDDQAPWAIGASGNQQAITPHMDRLVSQGAYLVNSFVTTPVCSPSRAATLTGRYGYEVGVFNWFKPTDQKQGLDLEEITFAEALRDAGYHTGLVGKWHLGMNDRYYPTYHGFEYFMGHRHGGFKTVDPDLEEQGEKNKYEGLTADILADHVIDFLTDHVAHHQEQPFLLNWHTRAPHTRWLPVAPEDMQPYAGDVHIDIPEYPDLDSERVTQMMREYLASVRSVDRNLGRVMQALDELKLTQNTVVIFTSDHGYNMGHNGIWHKGNGNWILKHDVPATHNVGKNMRPNMYDNSVRVPTMVRWPGIVKAGRQIAQTTSNLDWFPTLLEMAGVEKPDDKVTRGRSLIPLLRGDKPIEWNNDMFGFYSSSEDYANQFVEEMRMIRTPRWKLVRYLRAPERDELFDLNHDPEESKNEIGNPAYKTIILNLHEKIVQRMTETSDPALVYLQDDLPPFLRPLARPAGPVSAFRDGFAIEDDHTIILFGGTNALESSRQGYLETLLTAAHPEHPLRFRNMAWQADTVYRQQRPRNFYSINKPDYGERDRRKRERADLVLFWMGQTESLEGVENVARFAETYSEQIEQISNYTRRVVLVTPVPFSEAPNLDLDIEKRNQSLAVYVEAIKEIGRAKKLPVVDLFSAFASKKNTDAWSENGLHLSSSGHWLAAEAFAKELGFAHRVSFAQRRKADSKLHPASIESLRQAIDRKNALWYRYWRPTNWAFLYGNRQTQPSSRDHEDRERRWFPEEISSVLPLIEEAERSINELME